MDDGESDLWAHIFSILEFITDFISAKSQGLS